MTKSKLAVEMYVGHTDGTWGTTCLYDYEAQSARDFSRGVNGR